MDESRQIVFDFQQKTLLGRDGAGVHDAVTVLSLGRQRQCGHVGYQVE